jgi:flagellin
LTVVHPNTGVSSVATITKGDAAATAQSIRSNLGQLGIGAEVSDADEVTLTFAAVPATTTSTTNLDVKTGANSLTAITKIDDAIEEVNIQRSKLGAVSNRLNHTVNNLTNISSNLSAAKGGIEDADFALETTNLAKNQILQQASTAMLAQANASKQNVLSLLQG